ncbi:hypothetical protein [Tumebacillus permanentifrigoris]|uniref:Uncharacterized protein n=1 Tax=Tumebacillus permanentifrigoris TaxID=378543 RepID=A0A316DR96_9BACL|nr:hypothetical protein [Tumebacillus permanentifrigoris]PWK06976.1 hypothetical protein C7459_11840 [Tumebacillus permanentifrigoris]
MHPQQHLQRYQQKAGEVEQATRSLINSAMFYLDDPSLPDSLGNARRCLETAKYVLEGLYIPSTPAESASPLAHADDRHWPAGVVESWGFLNNTDTEPGEYPYYPI